MVTKIRDSYLKPQNYSLGASYLWSFSLGILHGAWWPTCNRNMFLEPMVKCGLLRTLSIWSHSFQVSALIPWTMLLKSSRSSGMLRVHNFLLPSTSSAPVSVPCPVPPARWGGFQLSLLALWYALCTDLHPLESPCWDHLLHFGYCTMKAEGA